MLGSRSSDLQGLSFKRTEWAVQGGEISGHHCPFLLLETGLYNSTVKQMAQSRKDFTDKTAHHSSMANSWGRVTYHSGGSRGHLSPGPTLSAN